VRTKIKKVTEIIISAITKKQKDMTILDIKKQAQEEIELCNKYAQIVGLPEIKQTHHLYRSLMMNMKDIQENGFYIDEWDTKYSLLKDIISYICREQSIRGWNNANLKSFLEENAKVIEKSRV
jgi:hypothetical protein